MNAVNKLVDALIGEGIITEQSVNSFIKFHEDISLARIASLLADPVDEHTIPSIVGAIDDAFGVDYPFHIDELFNSLYELAEGIQRVKTESL